MKHKDFRFDKAASAFKRVLEQIQKGQKIKYNGPEIESNSILVCSCNIKTSFQPEFIEKEKEQNRDEIDILIAKIFQLGYSVGYETNEENNKFYKALANEKLTEFSKQKK